MASNDGVDIAPEDMVLLQPGAYTLEGEDEAILCRPCVDCGRTTGGFCDGLGPQGCLAKHWVPSEKWNDNQYTPLCHYCDAQVDGLCHFCRGVHLCRPAGWPTTDHFYRPEGTWKVYIDPDHPPQTQVEREAPLVITTPEDARAAAYALAESSV